MVAAPRVAVVVCTRDRPQLLGDALAAITADEIIVVDSGSRTDAAAAIGRDHGARVIRNARPGLSRARNAGVAAAASADVIAFTDDDCRPAPGWVDALARPFCDPGVGVAVGRVAPDHPGAAVPADDPGDAPFAFDSNADVSALGAGANMAFRRAALVALGGFDEVLGAGTRLRSGEDHDMIWRVLRAGWSGRYAPDAVVVHLDWLTAWQAVRKRYGYGLGAGAVAAKIARVDPRRGRRLLLKKFSADGAARAASDLRRGYERAAIGDLLYVTGILVGAGAVRRRPLLNGLLDDQPSWSRRKRSTSSARESASSSSSSSASSSGESSNSSSDRT